jgi:hypothetical protein
MWRSYWLSLSFANLVYLRAWADLLPLSPAFTYYRKSLPGLSLYFAIAADVLTLSLLTFLLIRLAPRLPGWLRNVLLVAAVAMVALAVHSVVPPDFRHIVLILVGVFSVVFAAVLFGFPSRTVRLLEMAAMAAAPCIAVTFAGSLFYPSLQTLPPNPPLAPRLSGTPPVRVLWIVFDEWDQRLTFADRAPGTLLPVLDRLAGDSFTATRAVAPLAGMPVSQMATADAVPSLLYGKRVLGGEIEDAATRRLNFGGGVSTVLGQGASIFARVRSQGWNAAAAGWYLPYCRVFSAQLTDCYWDEMYEQRSSTAPAFPAAALDETRMLFETRMYSVFGPSLVNIRHVAEYRTLLAAARRYAADPTLGLAFIHFNIPHVPYFYDPKVGRFGHYGFSDSLYNDALGWVDRSVGDILSSLRNAGLDRKTAIILSSDHPLRTSSTEPYVPYIVHLPGGAAGTASAQECSTLRSADLALAIARGEVKSPWDVENFLAHSR